MLARFPKSIPPLYKQWSEAIGVPGITCIQRHVPLSLRFTTKDRRRKLYLREEYLLYQGILTATPTRLPKPIQPLYNQLDASNWGLWSHVRHSRHLPIKEGVHFCGYIFFVSAFNICRSLVFRFSLLASRSSCLA